MSRKAKAGKQLCFHYGDTRIEFTRLDRESVTDKVRIRVTPTSQVQIWAPSETSDADVIAIGQRRARWIYEQLQDFLAKNEHVLPRQYISGESQFYLGKRHLLKVIMLQDTREVQRVRMLRGKVEVHVRKKDPNIIRNLLTNWYKQRAKIVFARRLKFVLPRTPWVQQAPQIHIKTMHTQWGSCSLEGRLTLNPHLVKAPNACIDYVILHELCHLKEHNHSKRYYRLLDSVLPDWRKVEKHLDQIANTLLNQ